MLKYSIMLPMAMLGGCYLPDSVIVEAPNVLYSAVSAGDYEACGLTTEGEVYCWPTSYPRPQLMSGSVRFSAISTYGGHTCGISVDGGAYCWGDNEWGQLGTASELRSCLRSGVSAGCATNPVPVATDLLFRTISVGASYTCALAVDGRAHCWGLNAWGQLGAVVDSVCATDLLPGGIPCSPLPVPVDGELVFETLSTGQAHACAVTPEGVGYCWGAGGSGRLGNGSLEDSPVPSPVAGNLSIRSLRAGGSHTCAVVESGAVYCWGSNAGLQLGSSAAERGCGDQVTPCVTTPHPTTSPLLFESITVSGTSWRMSGVPAGHTCGISVDDSVYCWGLNENGQLAGHWDLASSKPVMLDVDAKFVQLDAGMANTCGVTTDGQLYCWQYGTPLSGWREFETPR